MQLPGEKRWTSGICTGLHGPCSYGIRVGEAEYCRNRRHILKGGEMPTTEQAEKLYQNKERLLLVYLRRLFATTVNRHFNSQYTSSTWTSRCRYWPTAPSLIEAAPTATAYVSSWVDIVRLCCYLTCVSSVYNTFLYGVGCIHITGFFWGVRMSRVLLDCACST